MQQLRIAGPSGCVRCCGGLVTLRRAEKVQGTSQQSCRNSHPRLLWSRRPVGIPRRLVWLALCILHSVWASGTAHASARICVCMHVYGPLAQHMASAVHHHSGALTATSRSVTRPRTRGLSLMYHQLYRHCSRHPGASHPPPAPRTSTCAYLWQVGRWPSGNVRIHQGMYIYIRATGRGSQAQQRTHGRMVCLPPSGWWSGKDMCGSRFDNAVLAATESSLSHCEAACVLTRANRGGPLTWWRLPAAELPASRYLPLRIERSSRPQRRR